MSIYVYMCLRMCMHACAHVCMLSQYFYSSELPQDFHRTLKPAIGTCNVAVKNSSVYRKDSSQSDVRLQSHLVTQ